jgi:GT2 family glycosyltransferase
VALLEKRPQVAAVQPRLVSIPHPGYLDYSGAAGGMLDRYGYPFAVGRIFTTIEPDQGQYREPMPIFWASGTVLLLRRKVLEEVGYLDEDFFMHMEEIDLQWRMQLAGYFIWVQPRVSVAHHSGYSLPAADRKKIYLNHRNSLIMMIKNYSTPFLRRRLAIRLLLDWLTIFQALLTLNGDRALAVLQAHVWILKHWSSIWRKHREVQSLRRITDAELDRRLYPKSIVVSWYLKKLRTFPRLNWRIEEQL